MWVVTFWLRLAVAPISRLFSSALSFKAPYRTEECGDLSFDVRQAQPCPMCRRDSPGGMLSKQTDRSKPGHLWLSCNALLCAGLLQGAVWHGGAWRLL